MDAAALSMRAFAAVNVESGFCVVSRSTPARALVIAKVWYSRVANVSANGWGRGVSDIAIPSLPRQPGALFARGGGYWAAAIQHGVSAMKTTLLSLSAAAFVAIGAMALGTSPARAQVEYPWCAFSNLNGGSPSCSYSTVEQCQAFLAGQGYCQPNPRAAAPAPRRGAR
jgi:hypothetical protein